MGTQTKLPHLNTNEAATFCHGMGTQTKLPHLNTNEAATFCHGMGTQTKLPLLLKDHLLIERLCLLYVY